MSFFENNLAPEEVSESFRIMDDRKAEWALGKIKEAK